MRPAALLALLLLAAGCLGPGGPATSTSSPASSAPPSTAPPPPPEATLGLFANVWRLDGGSDTVAAWIHRTGPTPIDYVWNLTAAQGQPLPEGWRATFSPPAGRLEPVGTRRGEGANATYPDWAWVIVTLHVPEDTPPGPRIVELRAAGGVQPVPLMVGPPGEAARPGQPVTVQYTQRLLRTNEIVAQGTLDVVAGRPGGDPPGLGLGVLGVAEEESLRIVVPPAFAYGYDNPAGPRQAHNGEAFLFDVRAMAVG